MAISGGLNVDVDRIRKNWGWYVALGVILVLLGGVAIASPFGVGLAVMVVLGILLIASGVAEIIVAIQTRGWQGIALNLLAGILEIVVGIVVLKCPVTSLVVMTMFFTIYLLVGGIFRIFAAISLRIPGTGWLVLSGIVTTLLGVMLLAEMPAPAEWLIGTFVGIDLIFHGISWIALALGLRKGTPAIA